MRVLSLFDGISCGRLALHNLGVKPEKYFAFEIDKHAIKVSRKNWSDIIQCGDINFHKWHKIKNIDLLFGGSPCQGFSTLGKYENFEHKESRLFFKFVECLEYYKPKYFLLENIKMKKEYRDKITSYVKYAPVRINSKDFGAQSRTRNYWANFDISTAKKISRKIIFDILDDRKNWGKFQGIYTLYKKKEKYFTDDYLQKKKVYFDDSNHISIVGKRDLDFSLFKSTFGVNSVMHKSQIILTMHRTKIALDKQHYRCLSDTELERLQGLPVNYTEGISSNQRNICIGNGWHIQTIEHILKSII